VKEMSKSKVKNDSSCDSDKKQLNHASGDGIKMNESALSNNSTMMFTQKCDVAMQCLI
jgi:hypothetical protein